MGPISEQQTPPPRLGRYRLVRCISSGGMARVYEARRESLAGVAPKVALKLILPEFAQDPTFQQLFVTEARIGSQLQHQNLVGIQDFDREGDHFFLVMEYVDGITLRRAVSTCRRNGIQIPLAVIAELGRQVAEGLHFAHESRNEEGQLLHLVHRDVKPSNIMLNPQGVAKVLDFGISKALTIAAEHSGTVKGTWGYMAPEQAAASEVGPAADQYGVAAVLYELAMLSPLFPEKKPAILRGLMVEDEGARRANRLSGEHAPLAALLVRALQRDPAARFRSCRELSQALARLVPDPVTAREQLVAFFGTLQTLGGEAPAQGPRSGPSAISGGSGMTLGSQPAIGLPVAVGSSQRAYAPQELAAPHRPAQPKGLSTGLIAALGLAACVLTFTIVALLSQQELTVAPVQPDPQVELALEDLLEPPAVVEADPEPELVKPQVVEPVVKPDPITPRLVAKPPPKKVQPPPEPVGLGMLTVSSLPRSKVVVDGQFVRYTPLFQYELAAGSHSVSLETDDGRRTRFKVDVPTNGEVRRIWHFETGQWVEQ